MLKDFTKEAGFADLVNEGTYNCLTATLLYSQLLRALDVEHEILEYPYHVNILITEEGSRVLLETTNPMAGFIDQEKEIEESIRYHQSGGGKEVLFPAGDTSGKKLSFEELAGLLFFNKAVYLFNSGRYSDAQEAVQQAQALYPSGRMRELENYIASLR